MSLLRAALHGVCFSRLLRGAGGVSSKGAGYWGWLRCGHVGGGDAGWVGRAKGVGGVFWGFLQEFSSAVSTCLNRSVFPPSSTRWEPTPGGCIRGRCCACVVATKSVELFAVG